MKSKYKIFALSLLYWISGINGQETELKNHDWTIKFNGTTTTTVDMYDETKIFCQIDRHNRVQSAMDSEVKIKFFCSDQRICESTNFVIHINGSHWDGYAHVKGNLIGRSKLLAELHQADNRSVVLSASHEIIVVKKVGLMDTIFTISLGIMISVIFVSFGAALDMASLKGILMKPIGPIIGFCCQFILMPCLSYLLGYVLFAKETNMWLGLFFSGVTPGGGASNMWTLLLKGNVNLSIIMTTISNLAAFAMMPFWIFTLGKTIFERGDLGVPYERIAMLSVSLIVPLVIGLLIQKYQPKLANVLVRLLKPISVIILIFIIGFAILTNFFLFKLFSWKIIIAGMGLPWVGYSLSYLIAWLLKQNKPDCLTICIETGLQNTSVAIFLLRFSLEQPEADLTSIVPVAVSIMTKVPLLSLYLIQKYCCSNAGDRDGPMESTNEEQEPMTKR